MVELETVSELAESIADMVGVYGCWTETDVHPDDCKCRICFVSNMEDRIRQAIANDEFAHAMGNFKKQLEEVCG